MPWLFSLAASLQSWLLPWECLSERRTPVFGYVPSRPSHGQAGFDQTKKLVKRARFMDLEVLDHLILTLEGYLYHPDEGMM